MFGLQPFHLIVIIFIALLIFGPSRMTEIGRAMGKTLSEFKAGATEPLAKEEKESESQTKHAE